jgi:hypothetical protein
MSSEPLSSLYWPPDVAHYSMETVLYSSSGWLRTACIVFALFWWVLLQVVLPRTVANTLE